MRRPETGFGGALVDIARYDFRYIPHGTDLAQAVFMQVGRPMMMKALNLGRPELVDRYLTDAPETGRHHVGLGLVYVIMDHFGGVVGHKEGNEFLKGPESPKPGTIAPIEVIRRFNGMDLSQRVERALDLDEAAERTLRTTAPDSVRTFHAYRDPVVLSSPPELSGPPRV